MGYTTGPPAEPLLLKRCLLALPVSSQETGGVGVLLGKVWINCQCLRKVSGLEAFWWWWPKGPPRLAPHSVQSRLVHKRSHTRSSVPTSTIPKTGLKDRSLLAARASAGAAVFT